MLEAQLHEGRSFSKTLALSGRLDSETVGDFDRVLDEVLASPIQALVFDLAKLTYVSSAGLRSFFRAQKILKAGGGEALMVNVQPQVEKVFEIVKTVDLKSVFRDVAELDAYLDVLQKKVIEDG